jgi:parallel beta-helix repeat protein
VTRAYFRIAITFGLVLALACIWRLEKVRVSASAAQQNHATAVRAQLSDTVSVHAAQRGFPYINLSDGRELLASFDSDSETAAQWLATQTNGLSPLAMTSADLDEDGVADLICSYDSPQGAFIAVYRGNVDAIYPHTAGANQRHAQGTFTDAPFLAPVRMFAVPVAGELMVAGDVNGDGRQDIVITSRASRSLYVMAGDGKGSIHLAKEVALPGAATALAAGDVNRRDGLIDILVGLVGDSGPRALVFEGPVGALNAEPEMFALPAAANSFAIGQFDNDPAVDIAIAAGRSLLMIYGRDRKLIAGTPPLAGVKQATTGKRDFSFNVKAITSGKFSDGPGLLSDIGLLADDGAIYVLRVKLPASARKAKKRAPQWAVEKLSMRAQSNATQLRTARVSSLPTDTMLLLDAGGHQVRIIETAIGKTGSSLAKRNATVDLDVEGEAIAALPMRLNVDALDDLVILRRGESAPTILTSAPAAILNVTNNGDNGGVDPAPGAGTGTLRQAIVDANSTVAADTIQFTIGSGLQTISLAAPLPTITQAVTIDATTQPVFTGTPLIELSGMGAGAGANGLTLQTSNSTVRGLVINQFSGFGIFIVGGNANFIEGNFIGTDPVSAMGLPNVSGGVGLQDANNNTIGGTVAGTSNVLSGNGTGAVGSGLSINGGSNNSVQNNFIGTNRTGTAAIGNNLNGIAIGNSTNNIIGSTRNLISGNGASGIVLATSANGTNIQGNFIGTDIDGAGAIGNTGPGITVFDSSNVTITGNIISGNGDDGVHLENTAPGGQNNAVRGNFIGTDSIGTTAIPNTGNGVGIVSMPGNTIGGTTAADRNIISGNGAGGVGISGDSGTNNTVTGNFIGTDVNGTAALANSGSGVSISTGPNNIVGGTVAGSGNLLSGNLSSGVFIQDGAAGTLVQGNFIGTNAAGTAGVPNGNGVVCTNGATGVTVGGTTAGASNTIAFNTFFGVFVNSGTAHSNAILGNSIFSNGSLGIGLSDDAVTPNDGCDVDAGPNDLQNFPLITAVISGGMPTVQGTLNSTANTTFRLEFFKNATCDASGNGQGQTFIGSTNVATDAACNAMFNVMLPVALAAGDVVTATATDSANNTSEFSPCFTAPAATNADLSVALNAMPNPVSAGSDLTFMALVANAGPDPATNVTLTEAVPANTTFQSLNAPPGWSCSTPGVGGTGTIICTNASLVSGASAMFTLVVNVNPGTPGGTVISSTATVDSSTSDPNSLNNSANAMATVAGGSCTITCPADVTVNSGAAQCGANVNYPSPTLNGSCGQVTCAPPAGSFFPRGSTNVKCDIGGGPSCSFIVTVVDNTPPAISCPPSITVGTSPGKNFAVVDYPIATATDACGVANVVCLPPSGSTFPLGISTVNCSARDVANNTANCSFTVTVNDIDAPVIHCPNNIAMQLPPTQTSAVVNYPLPTIEDNLPGVTVTCAPPSGSTFPLGVTAVVCVAVDVTGNRSTCGFSISLTGGPPLLEVLIPNGKAALEFGTDRPTPVARKHKNLATGPCAAFTVVNRSFSRLDLTLDAIMRIGSDVNSGHITDAKEGDTYSLSVVNANGIETPLDIGDTVSLPVEGRVNFCLRFSPVLPPVAGSNTKLSAPQAIPDLINSRVTFRVAGGSTLSVNVNAIVETALHLINPNNPKKAATLRFTKSGDEFSVTFAVHDANGDVGRARYEFLDAGGVVIAGPFDVDLTQAIRERNLVRGQSFTVTQRFTGASSNPNASAVRVTVFDGETNVTSPIVVLDTTAANATVQAASYLRFTPVTPPAVRMNSSLP